MSNDFQNENNRDNNNKTASLLNSRKEFEELQKAIAQAHALASNMNETEQTSRSTMKDAVDRLASVQRMMLESEKSRMKSLQSESSVKEVQTAQAMKNNLANVVLMRPKITRSYKLTSKASYEVWLDSLKTELTSWMLLDMIDPNVPEPTGLSAAEVIVRKNSVKGIIIIHIDEDYHKKILGLTEPLEILNKLRDSRKGEVSSTPTSIRTRLYNLRMDEGERVHDFCERFDQIIREHELSDDPEKLTEQEKRSTFYQAIIGVMPEIRRTDSAVVMTTGKEMGMDALRKAMRRIQKDNDADPKNAKGKNPTASRAVPLKSKGNNSA